MPRYDLGEKRIAGTAEVRESLIKGWGRRKREREYMQHKGNYTRKTLPQKH